MRLRILHKILMRLPPHVKLVEWVYTPRDIRRLRKAVFKASEQRPGRLKIRPSKVAPDAYVITYTGRCSSSQTSR